MYYPFLWCAFDGILPNIQFLKHYGQQCSGFDYQFSVLLFVDKVLNQTISLTQSKPTWLMLEKTAMRSKHVSNALHSLIPQLNVQELFQKARRRKLAMHKERVEERKRNPDLKNITKTVDSKPFCVKLRKLIKDLMRTRSHCSISPPARPPLLSTVPLALSPDDGDECESDDRSTANSSPSTGFC